MEVTVNLTLSGMGLFKKHSYLAILCIKSRAMLRVFIKCIIIWWIVMINRFMRQDNLQDRLAGLKLPSILTVISCSISVKCPDIN